MSIEPINFAQRKKDYNKKLLITTGAGAVTLGTISSLKKNWIYKDGPSDSFVKNMSKNLTKTMTTEQQSESKKINEFLNYVVDPESNLDALKQNIKDSKELSEAIKNPGETVEEAITRVYSNPDQDALRQNLLNLQNKTKSDKIASTNATKRLIYENFDADAKKLVKSETTSDKMFKLIQKSAKTTQLKSIALKTALGGIFAGALYLVCSKVPEKKVK